MLFKFNRLTLSANIFSLQFIEISEYQPSSSYRASKSRFFPYIHCKFCRVCPTTKMTSATVKPSIASVSVGLGSKERPRNRTGTVFCPLEIGARAKILERGGGGGEDFCKLVEITLPVNHKSSVLENIHNLPSPTKRGLNFPEGGEEGYKTKTFKEMYMYRA